jgi:poly(3-hydroxybutyrate) depolymerase
MPSSRAFVRAAQGCLLWLTCAGTVSDCGGGLSKDAADGGGGTTGAGGLSTAGATGTAGGGTAGAQGTAGGSTGATGLAGTTGTAGAAGAAGTTGAAGDAGGGSAGGPGGMGGSLGCRVPAPTGIPFAALTTHVVKVAGLDPAYLPGGAFAAQSGTFDLTNRPYAVRLPGGYFPDRTYPVVFEAGGCGGTATQFAASPGSALRVGSAPPVIEVVLTFIDGCFLDGGPAIGNRPDTPELPYFRAVLADVEAQFCVDTSKVFLQGYGSGAWEAETLGCAAGDVVTGIAVVGGGLREKRPPCTGGVAAMLVINTNDMSSPLGPLDPTDPAFVRLGSAGDLPARDELLARDGCLGNASVPWMFPSCVKFTGCPAATPVVWCQFAGSGQAPTYFQSTNFLAGPLWTFLTSVP